ncbi:ADP-ribosylation factor-like protein [Candidatus Hodarchaeum mangrovi]
MHSTNNIQSKKLVLLGLAETGKSTIIKNALEGIITRPGEKYDATINYQRKIKRLCGLEIIIFDLGGQTRFLDKFTGDLSRFVFSDIDAFIFVIDPLQTALYSRSKYYLELSLERMKIFSSNAEIFVFLHKMDLIPRPDRDIISDNLKKYLTSEINNPIQYYETSVFNESIYEAIGSIISKLFDLKRIFNKTLIDYITKNIKTIVEVHLLTHEGIFLLQASNNHFKNSIPHKKIRKYFIYALEQKTLFNKENTVISVEGKKNVYLTYFLERGLAVLIAISKQDLTQDLKFSSKIYEDILKFVFSLNEKSNLLTKGGR